MVGTWKGNYCLLFSLVRSIEIIEMFFKHFQIKSNRWWRNETLFGVLATVNYTDRRNRGRIGQSFSLLLLLRYMPCVCLDYVIDFILNRQSTELITYVSSWYPECEFHRTCFVISYRCRVPVICELNDTYLFQLIRGKLSVWRVNTHVLHRSTQDLRFSMRSMEYATDAERVRPEERIITFCNN